MRLIDADALKEWVETEEKTKWGLSTDEVWDAIESAPTIDSVKHGKWIYPTDIVGFGRCDNCKALWDVSLIKNKFFKHCPRCGARMDL